MDTKRTCERSWGNSSLRSSKKKEILPVQTKITFVYLGLFGMLVASYTCTGAGQRSIQRTNCIHDTTFTAFGPVS